MIVRRPDSILNAQFWADDNEYFSDQLTVGFWAAFTRLHGGFSYLTHRLIAVLGSLVPIARAPLLYNSGAIAIASLAVATFALPGFRHLVRNGRLRVAVCLATACMPANQELLATVANVGWFLAIWLSLLSVMRTPRTAVGMAYWCVGGAIAVFSTPLAAALAPLWALRALRGLRHRCGRDIAFAATQSAALLAVFWMTGTLGAGLRTMPDRGVVLQWKPADLWSALGALGRVMTSCLDAALLPPVVFQRLEGLGAPAVVALALLVGVGLALAARDLSARGRVTVGLASYLFASSLYVIIAGRPAAVALLHGETPALNLRLGTLQIFSPRYRALPNFAMLLAVAGFLDGAQHARTRVAVVAVACTGLLLAWAPEFRIPPLPDLRWPIWAARLEHKLASGSREPLVIPSFPPTFEISLDAKGIEPAPPPTRTVPES